MKDEDIAMAFVKAFEKADVAQLTALMAEDVVNYVTNREGGVDKVLGREPYLKRVKAMEVATAHLRLAVPQILTIKPGQVLLMVEVRAERSGKILHNFSAFLMEIKDNQIRQTWMVEALPEKSDDFWK
ncbi:MAG: nuclear transport factor 2 family protein [Alphaproteobacteria bacterium]|nr:nuclear transport factor 2 family protein [Alphaproteobacteria bacterium]